MREKLKSARQAKRMTQQQVADQLKIGLRHYKKIESGETMGSIAVWDMLEDLFQINQRVLRENHHGTEDNP